MDSKCCTGLVKFVLNLGLPMSGLSMLLLVLDSNYKRILNRFMLLKSTKICSFRNSFGFCAKF